MLTVSGWVVRWTGSHQLLCCLATQTVLSLSDKVLKYHEIADTITEKLKAVIRQKLPWPAGSIVFLNQSSGFGETFDCVWVCYQLTWNVVHLLEDKCDIKYWHLSDYQTYNMEGLTRSTVEQCVIEFPVCVLNTQVNVTHSSQWPDSFTLMELTVGGSNLQIIR